MKTLVMITALIFLFITPFFCHAEENLDKPFIPKPFIKLGRGMVNTISSPLELPNQMYLLSNHAYENSQYGLETASAAIEGFLMGTVYTFWRLGAGTYDLLTFPLPKYEFCLITPIYLTVSHKEYYAKEKKENHEKKQCEKNKEDQRVSPFSLNYLSLPGWPSFGKDQSEFYVYLSVAYGRVVSTIKINFDQTISVERDQLIVILATFLPEIDFDEFIGGGGHLNQGEFHYSFTLPEEILDIESPFEIPEKRECGLFIKDKGTF